jgi:hypothetical protein
MRPINLIYWLSYPDSRKSCTKTPGGQAFFLSIGNIEQPASNNPQLDNFSNWMLDAGCSALDVFLIPKKTISPCPAFRSSRDKWGMGVRHSLFPGLALGATLAGAASFPTPFSTASGVFGLVAGPSSAFRPLDFE